MTLRVIVRNFDASAAAHVGGPVEQWFETFDLEAPELEKRLRENKPQFGGREVVGVELIAAADAVLDNKGE